MLNLEQIKITRRDQDILKLLLQGCSNKEIAAELNISPRTVKQHLRTLFLRAGIKQGRKRVILATAIFEKEQLTHVPREQLIKPQRNHRRHHGVARKNQSRNRRLPGQHRTGGEETSCVGYSISWACGAGWSWRCTWLRTEARAGLTAARFRRARSNPMPCEPGLHSGAGRAVVSQARVSQAIVSQAIFFQTIVFQEIVSMYRPGIPGFPGRDC